MIKQCLVGGSKGLNEEKKLFSLFSMMFECSSLKISISVQ